MNEENYVYYNNLSFYILFYFLYFILDNYHFTTDLWCARDSAYFQWYCIKCCCMRTSFAARCMARKKY